MNISIRPTEYKDQKALLLENEFLRTLVLPELGAKIASITFKPSNQEILFQRPGDQYLLQPYDGVYTDAENAGLDDMFPTIDTFVSEQVPWNGIRLPDHGEVWSLPWECKSIESGLHFSVHGIRLPYRLEKTLTFPSNHILRMEYTLTNLSASPFDYLWAAHCMFNSEPDAEILLPAGVTGATLTFSNNPALGKFGDPIKWPVTSLSNGASLDLTRMRGKDQREVKKFYLNEKVSAGWCATRMKNNNLTIGLSWPIDQVPYLAILPNEGGWDDACCLYFEPSTCTFDRPDFGRKRNQVSTISGFATHHWYLNLTITEAIQFTSISPDGLLS
jgi:hypothetical protein